MLPRQLQTRPVAPSKQHLLPAVLLPLLYPIHGSHGVNDLFARQPVRIRDLGIASVAAVEGPAFAHELWACCAVDGPVYAAAAEERLVCCVDNGGDCELGDVVLDEGDAGVERGVWSKEDLGG